MARNGCRLYSNYAELVMEEEGYEGYIMECLAN